MKNDEKEVKGTGHIYDGIEELDHGIPGWFRALFFSTILFAAGYFFHFQLGDGASQEQEYQRKRVADETAMYAARGSEPVKVATEDELRIWVKDEGRVKAGAQSYQTKCASCHGAKGEGGIGPNLTDDHWIHGAKLTEVLKSITDGVADKGMPPWGPVLGSDELRTLTAYVRSIHGTNPPRAKAPQGVRVVSQ